MTPGSTGNVADAAAFLLSLPAFNRLHDREIQVLTLYGIKSCDTVRKARRWLDQHAIDYQYHDLREDGLATSQAQAWLKTLGAEELLNRRSTTWKTLPHALREGLDAKQALGVVLEHPTLIKRPLLDIGGEIHLGFTPERYQALFNKHTL